MVVGLVVIGRVLSGSGSGSSSGSISAGISLGAGHW